MLNRKIRRKVDMVTVLVILICTFSHSVIAATANPAKLIDSEDITTEKRYLEAVEQVLEGNMDAALQTLESLLERNPRFALARLMYADLLAARARPLRQFGGEFADTNRASELEDEALRRVSHFDNIDNHDHNKWPSNILRLAPSQKHVVIVEESNSRIYVFENQNDRLQLVGDFYVSVAKQGMIKNRQGDKRTPVGVYFITSKLDPDNLGDLYGHGALPINYPNEWDRRLGRTGYGIWLHGVPSNTYARAPYASDGCLAMSNEHIDLLMNMLDTGSTPVIIVEDLESISRLERDREQFKILSQLNRWNRDRASGNTDRYLAHYSDNFSSDNGSVEHLLNFEMAGLDIDNRDAMSISEVSMFRYPGETDLVTVSFKQSLGSDLEKREGLVRQYWQLEDDGVWRIVQQDNASFLPIHFRGIPEQALQAANIEVPKK